MKKVISNIIKFLGVFCLAACNNNSSSINSSSSSKLVSFNESAESFLIEGTDYIDHATTYDGKEFEYDQTMWYINNLHDVPLPDPHVYYENGKYYITGTTDRNEGATVDVYVTENFVDYSHHLSVYDPSDFNGWENTNPGIYAPEIYLFNGVYYMYYSAYDQGGTRRSSVVKANNPLGPYEPIQVGTIDGLKNPIFNYDYESTLDATIFVDDDNQMYMYYGISGQLQSIVGVKMKSPYEADWSTRVELVKPGYLDSTSLLKPLTWECLRSNSKQIAEAPYMIKSNGKYYLTYSVNGCWNKYYSVCYAVSDTPLGNYTKPYKSGQTWTNLLLGYPGLNVETSTVFNQWSGFASGTGHHCFFNIGDQIMIGYHAHQNRNFNSEKGYVKRYFAMDYLHFDKDGVPFCNGPSWSLQPLPEELSGYRNVAENAEVASQNIQNIENINDNYVVDCYNLQQEEGKEVVLGTGKSYIELEFDTEYSIGGISIYNSSYFDKYIPEIEYIDFGNGNAVYYSQYCIEKFVNEDTSFVFPNSAITVEFPNTFKSKKVIVCFNLPNGGQINEIKVLGC